VATKKQNEDTPQVGEFEEALTGIEAIVRQLEDGNVGLAEAMEKYEQGVGLLKQCHKILASAERRIELLSGVDADGNPIVEPFDDEPAESLEKKSANRGRRRTRASSRPKQSPTDEDDDTEAESLF
jgi:exodeoxyribonuclease VII small subunit